MLIALGNTLTACSKTVMILADDKRERESEDEKTSEGSEAIDQEEDACNRAFREML